MTIELTADQVVTCLRALEYEAQNTHQRARDAYPTGHLLAKYRAHLAELSNTSETLSNALHEALAQEAGTPA